MLDKIFLTLFGLEWFGFGVLGLFFPDIIAGMLGVTAYSESNLYLNETRALYAFFTILGLMSFISLIRPTLQKRVYLTFTILMGSFLIGRLLSFGLDASFDGTSAAIFINEFSVFFRSSTYFPVSSSPSTQLSNFFKKFNSIFYRISS